MKILFLTHYFPPEVNAPASRTYEHARTWVQEGHEVTVITCAPNHPAGILYKGYRNRLLQMHRMDGIRIVRVWTYLAANEGFLKRTANYLSYMMSAVLCACFLPRPEVVISTSPQFFCGLAGYPVSRFKKVPWVLEIRDLWPDSILALGAVKNRAIIRALQRLEDFAYLNADRIIALTRAFKDHIASKGVPSGKISVISNGVDLSFYRELPKDNPISHELGISDKFVVSYFGTHGMAHGLETVLEAADKLRGRPDILFLLVGDGAEKQKLQSLKERAGLPNVLMLDQASKQKMPYLWALSDVSMVLLRKRPVFRTVLPSKMFEAMAMQLPIILGVEGESKEIIEKGRCGICIEPENSRELSAAVLQLYENPELRKSLALNGRRLVENDFDRQKLALEMLDVLEQLL